jgi:hypothetical protein
LDDLEGEDDRESVDSRTEDGEDWTDGDDGVDGIVAGDPRGAVVGAFVKDGVGFVAGVAEPTTGGFNGPVVNVFVDPIERKAVSILP